MEKDRNVLKKMEEALDERFQIWSSNQNQPDWFYYLGMTAMVERMGYMWERFESGKHIIYGGD